MARRSSTVSITWIEATRRLRRSSPRWAHRFSGSTDVGKLRRMGMISIALSKGRILDETAPLLARVGLRPAEDAENSRKLIIGTQKRGVRLIVVRASDVPTYVGHGAAELGIAGGDVLAEHGGAGLYQPVDLGIARCRMVVAARRGYDYQAAVRQGARLRVATQYVPITRQAFAGN